MEVSDQNELEVYSPSNVIPTGRQLLRTPVHKKDDLDERKVSSTLRPEVLQKDLKNVIPTGKQLPRTPVVQEQHPQQIRSTSHPIIFEKENHEPKTEIKNLLKEISMDLSKREDGSFFSNRKATAGENSSLQGTPNKNNDKEIVAQSASERTRINTPKYGSRTGFQIVGIVSRDDNGFEDINSFWGDTPTSFVQPRTTRQQTKSTDPKKVTTPQEVEQTAQQNSPKPIKQTERAPLSVMKMAASADFRRKPLLRDSLDNRNFLKRRLQERDSMDTILTSEEPPASGNNQAHIEADHSPHEMNEARTQDMDYKSNELLDTSLEEEVWNSQAATTTVETNRTQKLESPSPKKIKIKKNKGANKVKLNTPSSAFSKTSSALSTSAYDSADDYQDALESGSDAESLPPMTPSSNVPYKGCPDSIKKRSFTSNVMELDTMESEKLIPHRRRSHEPTPGLRRSKRQRWSPLKHWKGERLITKLEKDEQAGLTTVVIGAGKPTMFKTPKPTKLSRPVLFPKGFKADDPETPVRVRYKNGYKQKLVVRGATNLHESILPVTGNAIVKLKGKSVELKPPRAAAAFDDEKFLSGLVILPPLSTKSREETQDCIQVFMVMSAQSNSIRINVQNRNYVLSQGDHFWVPANSFYSIDNFSDHVQARISFVLIKPAKKVK